MEERRKRCSCFGCADVEITDELRTRVEKEIDKAIENGVRDFLFGDLSDFDDLVYDLVSLKMAQNPQLGIKRIIFYPLDRAVMYDTFVELKERGRFHKSSGIRLDGPDNIPGTRDYMRWFQERKYEGYNCPPEKVDWWLMVLYYRNCKMVDISDFVLFYAEKREYCEVYGTYQYAVKGQKNFVNFVSAEF